jgi:hypothetical protein
MRGGGSSDDDRGNRPAVKRAGEDRDGDGAGRVGGGRAPSRGRERPAVDSRADNKATGSSGGLASCMLGAKWQDSRQSREPGRIAMLAQG